jgi:hypothetical protein
MKNLKKMMSAALGGLTLALLLAGCADILNSPAAPEAKPGKVTLTIGSGPARTVTPDVDQFKRIILTFEGRNGSPDLEDADVKNGSATVDLPVGEWDVTAKAYLSAIDTTPAAASDAHVISWNGAVVSGDTAFILRPTGTGNGTLQYTVTVPVTLAAGSRIQIEADGAVLETLDGDGFTDGVHDISVTETDKTVSLAAGSYTVDILLKEDGTTNTAVYRESVVILSGLVTKFEFAPAAGNFLDPDLWAILTDITDGLEFNTTMLNSGDIDIVEYFGDPSSPVLEITAPTETETVYFILEKTVKHSITVGGTDSAYVTIPGTVTEGSSPSDELVVFAVDTSDIAATGGTKEFTITVSNEGMAGVEVAVTVTVPAAQIGAGLYIDNGGLTAVPGFTWAGLQSALAWLGTNAVDDTEYVILLDGDEEVTASYVSKAASTGVRITLRGLEEERAVYWDEGTQFAGAYSRRGIFVVLKGTTLVLDEYVNLGGGDGETYRAIGGTVSNPTLIVLFDGALEMLPGSRISGLKNVPLVSTAYNTNTGSTFTMNGGTIEDNIISSNGLVYDTQKLTFEMFEGAAIKNNKVPGYIRNMSVQDPSVFSGWSAGKFTMHGGIIKDNDMRGIYLVNGAQFVMEGGEISGNGTGEYTHTTTNNKVYIWGAGVVASSNFQITITGGSIKNNGHEKSLGGGILATGSDTSRILINGSVSFANNAIALAAPAAFNYPPLYLGSSFVNTDASVISLEAGYANTVTNTSEGICEFLNEKIILNSATENGADLSIAVNAFELTRVFLATTNLSNGNYTGDHTIYWSGTEDINRTINGDGTLSVSIITGDE